MELLRADGSTAPRLASCKCVGEKGHEDEGCEVLVVTGHTFELLTDVFYGIRMKLVNQVCGNGDKRDTYQQKNNFVRKRTKT